MRKVFSMEYDKETLKNMLLETQEKYEEILHDNVKLREDRIRLNNIIEELEKWLNKQLKDTNKCLDYAREYHNLQDTEKYTRDHNMYEMILDYLDKLKELKEGK